MANANPPKYVQANNDSHSVYTALKRLFHTLVVCVVIALVVALVLLFQQYQQDWLTVQTRFSGESIARQYAKLLEPSHSNNESVDNEATHGATTNTSQTSLTRARIEKITAVLTQEPHIVGVSVFDKDGRYLAPLPKIDSVVAMSQTDGLTPLTYVEPVTNENGVLLGYVNIHMNTQAVLESPLTLRYQLTLIACILVFLALLLGIYVTRGFYKLRPWVIDTIESKRFK